VPEEPRWLTIRVGFGRPCACIGGRPSFLLLIYQATHGAVKTGAMYVQENSDIVGAPSSSPLPIVGIGNRLSPFAPSLSPLFRLSLATVLPLFPRLSKGGT